MVVVRPPGPTSLFTNKIVVNSSIKLQKRIQNISVSYIRLVNKSKEQH